MTRPRTQADAALDRLIVDFGSRLPIGSIIKTFTRAVQGLQLAGVDAGLIVAAEAMTRNQLTSRLCAGTPAR